MLQIGCLNMQPLSSLCDRKFFFLKKKLSPGGLATQSIIQTRRTRFSMEAKVDSMWPQESCIHTKYQKHTLEEWAVLKKHCNTSERLSQPPRHNNWLILSILYPFLDLIPDWLLFSLQGHSALLSLAPTFQLLSALCIGNWCVQLINNIYFNNGFVLDRRHVDPPFLY